MYAVVKANVTMTLEVEVGTFGSEWDLAGLQKDAQRAIAAALEHLRAVSASSKIAVNTLGTTNLSVHFYDVKK